MGDHRKPALHGSLDHRDGHQDAISGPWFQIVEEGDLPQHEQDELDVDYIELINGVVQPAPGSGPGGGDLEPWAFRRGLSPLDFKGHLDVSGASSPVIACVIPEAYLLPYDVFDKTVLYDGAAPVGGMWYLDSVTGELTLTWPVA